MNTYIISYRNEGNNYSTFLDINKFLNEENDFDKIFSIYKGIFNNINSYEHSKINKIEATLNRIFKKLSDLIKIENKFCLLKYSFEIDINETDKENEMKEINKKFNKISDMRYSWKSYLHKIKNSMLQKNKKVISEEISKKLKELKEVRLSNDDDELIRLKKNEHIMNSLKKIEEQDQKEDSRYHGHVRLKFDQKEIITYAHTLELQQKIKELGYFVFTHGEDIQMMVVNILTRKLKEKIEKDIYDTEVLRHDIFLIGNDVEWYLEKLKYEDDHEFRNELICADLFLRNILTGDSALYFFLEGGNIALTPKFLKNVLLDIAGYYFPNSKTVELLTKELLQLIEEMKQGKNLYSICVPKSNFEKVGYVSKNLGYPLDQNLYSTSKMEAIQDGEDPFDDENTKHMPQVRLLTSELNPENGVFILCNSTLDEMKIKEIEEKIELLIQRAYIDFRF